MFSTRRMSTTVWLLKNSYSYCYSQSYHEDTSYRVVCGLKNSMVNATHFFATVCWPLVSAKKLPPLLLPIFVVEKHPVATVTSARKVCLSPLEFYIGRGPTTLRSRSRYEEHRPAEWSSRPNYLSCTWTKLVLIFSSYSAAGGYAASSQYIT